MEIKSLVETSDLNALMETLCHMTTSQQHLLSTQRSEVDPSLGRSGPEAGPEAELQHPRL